MKEKGGKLQKKGKNAGSFRQREKDWKLETKVIRQEAGDKGKKAGCIRQKKNKVGSF